MLDLEALLTPIAEDAPSGPDLEYDPEWQELERLAQGKPEQQFGDTIIPAEEPDWREVRQRAEALLGRSKDARSACLLARALTALDQFQGLGDGLQLVYQLMDRYWDTAHPQLDTSDNNDPTMRLNALAALADPQGLLRVARGARLFSSRAFGDLTVRQVEIAAGKVQPREGEAVPALSQVEQQVAAAISQDATFAPMVTATVDVAKALARLLDDKVGADRSPDLKPMLSSLHTVGQLIAKVEASLTGVDAESGDAAASGEGSVPAGPAISASATIRSRTDALLLIDRICEFLQRTEPTNPAPLLLKRAKRIMDMDFLQIMQEMAPGGLDQVRMITGATDGSDSHGGQGY